MRSVCGGNLGVTFLNRVAAGATPEEREAEAKRVLQEVLRLAQDRDRAIREYRERQAQQGGAT